MSLEGLTEDESKVYDALLTEYSLYVKKLEATKRKLAASIADTPDRFAADFHTPEELLQMRLGRSADSIRGGMLESLADRLARLNFGPVERVIVSGGADRDECQKMKCPQSYVSGERKTVLWTRYSNESIVTEAAKLVQFITEDRSHRIGTRLWAAKLEEARARVRQAPREKRPKKHIFDLYTADASVGYGEMKAGGNLDNTKARVEVTEMVKAALALDTGYERLRFFIAYANNGEGKSIAGMLPEYFEPGHLLVGRQLWAQLLPDSVSVDRFEQLRAAAAAAARRQTNDAAQADS